MPFFNNNKKDDNKGSAEASSPARVQKLGVLAQKTGLMTEDQIQKVLSIQKDGSDDLFGVIAVKENFLTIDDLESLLELQSRGIGIDDGSNRADTSIVNMENISRDFFGPLIPYIYNDDITDIDFNGRDLWIAYSDGHREKTDTTLDEKFVKQFTSKIANSVNEQFNKAHPSLEAEAKTIDYEHNNKEISLRISVLSEIASITGRTINIRKTPLFTRITIDGGTKDKYFTLDEAAFLTNSVKAHMNIIICGEPGTGKTELSKWLSMSIPDNERVITIEDNLEWHYEKLKPNADCTAIKTYDEFNTSAAIKHCLRSNPKWLMVAEIRDMDAYDFIKGLSTGVNGITSIHCDNTHKIPDRILNMTKDPYIKEDVYNFVNVAVLVDRKLNNDGTVTRYIAQISVFHDNDVIDIFKDGVNKTKQIPNEMAEKFYKYHIDNPFRMEGTDIQ